MRSILDEQEVEFVAYLAYLIGVHVHASEVDRNDGLRFLVDSLTDGLGRNIPSSRIYVSEHRGATAVKHAVSRSGERNRGHDDLVARADPCSEACDMQRSSAVGDCGDIARTDGFPNDALEAFSGGSAGQKVASEHVHDRSYIVFVDRLATVTQQSFACRGAAMYGQLLHPAPPRT